jgi:arylsulfatase A-like enzyme
MSGCIRALAGTLLLLGAIARAQNARPNVLFILADDLRVEPDPTQVHTPSLDRLARESLQFGRAYCQIAVCGPSRVSLLSGARPDTTGVYENSTHLRKSRLPEAVTLPQLFKEHGYRTLSVGKIFHHEEVETGGDVRTRPGDDPRSWSEEPWHHGAPYQQWFTQGSADALNKAKAEAVKTNRRIVRGPPYEAADEPDAKYPDAQIAEKAIETLRQMKAQEQRFFLAVGFRRPHLPFNCPRKYWDLYPPEKIRLPKNYHPPKDAPPIALHTSYEVRSYAGIPANGPLSDHDALNLIRGYRASVTFLDTQVGRVLAELDGLGLARTTIVVFASDHGYHLGENGLWNKMTNFELATQVPLLFRLPDGRGKGRKTDALVELVDIYPTLAELCQLPLPRHVEGRSVVPLLANPDVDWKRAVFSQFPRRVAGGTTMGYSVRTSRYRYTEWKDASGSVELYDLAADPFNDLNLARQPQYREQVLELAQLLHGTNSAR